MSHTSKQRDYGDECRHNARREREQAELELLRELMSRADKLTAQEEDLLNRLREQDAAAKGAGYAH